MKHRVIKDPALAAKLFNTTAYAWLWVILRVYLGYQWLHAGWGKVTNPAWMAGGTALKGFLTNAVKVPAAPAKPPITYDWYRAFIQYLLDTGAYTWFAKVVAVAEVAVGIALIVGLLTGFAAFGGALMNFSFMLAGTTSTNPVLFLVAVLLILAWKVAGYYGADRWVLPALGTPWSTEEPEPNSV